MSESGEAPRRSGEPIRLSDVLRPEHVVVPLEETTFRGAVQALVRRLVATGAVIQPEKLDRLTSEERIRDVVHVGDRVLLPHLRTDAVERLVVALGVSPEPLHTLPELPEAREQIVVLVLAPASAANHYLQMIAGLARALRNDDVVARLVAARSPTDVFAIPEIGGLVVQPRLTVRDLMTQRVFRVHPDTPVSELIELMNRHDLKAVPVVGEKREVLGVVTDRDLLRFLTPQISQAGGAERVEAKAQTRTLSEIPVREIMSRSVMCVSEDQGLAEIVSIMVNKDVERVPVVSEGSLTGFLTRGDILRKLFGR
ncbi:MAG TPA: CBS domain-containing protein [Longimicrobiaceae bacterium]|nr:CBS domain-containing protein [Longimicrobiaceae bacterium]